MKEEGNETYRKETIAREQWRLKYTKEGTMDKIDMDKVDFENRILTCVDCGQDFVFSSSEQFFYWGKGLAEPKRCKSCRQFRRMTINRETERLKEGYDGNNKS